MLELIQVMIMKINEIRQNLNNDPNLTLSVVKLGNSHGLDNFCNSAYCRTSSCENVRPFINLGAAPSFGGAYGA